MSLIYMLVKWYLQYEGSFRLFDALAFVLTKLLNIPISIKLSTLLIGFALPILISTVCDKNILRTFPYNWLITLFQVLDN